MTHPDATTGKSAGITDEMIEAGARALHEVSTYRGYNQETLDREWLRMERIYKSHVKAVLAAALSQPAAREEVKLDI